MSEIHGLPGSSRSGLQGTAFSEGATGFTGYATPAGGSGAAGVLANAPAYKLFDANSVLLATFLGTPLAGSLLMAINYRRMGKRSAAIGAIALGIGLTAAAIALGYAIPQTATYAVSLGVLFGMRALAQSMQGEAVNQHEVQGGKLASRWTAAGLGLAILAVLAVIIFSGVFVQMQASKVSFGKDDVEFSGLTTKQDAQALGKQLQTMGYFGDQAMTVLLNKGKDGTTTVSFVVKEGAWDNPRMAFTFEEIGREAAPAVGGLPIKVQLVNGAKEVKKEMTVGRSALSKDEVFYFGAATETDAGALAQELKTEGFFEDRGTSVILSKDNGSTAISFIVAEGTWDDANKVAAFEQIVRGCAKTVGGLPIQLQLMTPKLELKKEVAVQ